METKRFEYRKTLHQAGCKAKKKGWERFLIYYTYVAVCNHLKMG